MKKLFPVLILLLAACQGERAKKAPQPKIEAPVVEKVADDDPVPSQEDPEEEETASADEDCVFDNRYKKFTTEALKKFDPRIKYTWDDKEKVAMTVFANGDTLLLSIGGCYHFGYSAELRTGVRFENDAQLIEKAKWLAQSFFSNGFDTKYVDCINQKQYKLVEQTDPSVKWYNIIDLETEETLDVYDGFMFTKKAGGKRTKVEINGYVS